MSTTGAMNFAMFAFLSIWTYWSMLQILPRVDTTKELPPNFSTVGYVMLFPAVVVSYLVLAVLWCYEKQNEIANMGFKD